MQSRNDYYGIPQFDKENLNDDDADKVRSNPYDNANFFSKIFFRWASPFLSKGYKSNLKVKDLYKISEDDESDKLTNNLEKEWRKQCTQPNPSLLKALIFFAKRRFLFYCSLFLFSLISTYSLSFQVAYLLKYTQFLSTDFTHDLNKTQSSYANQLMPGDNDKRNAYILAVVIGLTSCLGDLIDSFCDFSNMRTGMKCRIALCSLLYRKSLKLGHSTDEESSVGHLVNLMSNDVQQFDSGLVNLPTIIWAPVELVACVTLLWQYVGVSSLGCLLVIVVMIPYQVVLGNVFTSFRLKIAQQTDSRIQLMSEVISGIRVIKMYCWEAYFSSAIKAIRSAEVFFLYRSSYVRAAMMAPFFGGGKVMTFVVLLWFVINGGTLDTSLVFLVIGMCNNLNMNVNLYVPMALQSVGCCVVSLFRIQKYLLLEELPDLKEIEFVEDNAKENYYEQNEIVVQLRDASSDWKKNHGKVAILKNISLEVKQGELIALIGAVGSGKSSLLHLIMGEVPLEDYESFCRRSGLRVAYSPQEPWIFSSSIRQNITFGNEMKKSFYKKSIKSVALDKDLIEMINQDSTIIGEKGMSLSGGQRARLALARAVYCDADLYLLDDPLSAVDSIVGDQLFYDCIKGVLSQKTRILITHQLKYLKKVDRIIILDQGEMIAAGTYDELVKKGTDLHSYLGHTELTCEGNANNSSSILENRSSILEKFTKNVTFADLDVANGIEDINATSAISSNVYKQFIFLGTGFLGIFVLILLLLFLQFSYVFSDYWISNWAEHQQTYAMSNSIDLNTSSPYIPYHQPDFVYYVTVYSINTAAILFIAFLNIMIFFTILVKASEKLHNMTFKALVRTTIHFFDTNPVGRILNRFSKDIGQVDDLLPSNFYDVFNCTVCIVCILLTAAVINYSTVIIIVPLIVGFLVFRAYFLTTSRNVKRIEAATRSPVYTHLNASMTGILTIRCFKREHLVRQEFDGHQDLHSEAWFLYIALGGWLSCHLNIMCAVFLSLLSVASVYASDRISSSLIGLTLVNTINLIGLAQWAIFQSAELENQMTSVERLMEYADLQAEAPLETEEDSKPPSEWPSKGEIRVENLSFRYTADGPNVLKNLNFTVNPKEKIGIVGRTGAGKSTVIMCLFRLIDRAVNPASTSNAKESPGESATNTATALNQTNSIPMTTSKANYGPKFKGTLPRHSATTSYRYEEDDNGGDEKDRMLGKYYSREEEQVDNNQDNVENLEYTDAKRSGLVKGKPGNKRMSDNKEARLNKEASDNKVVGDNKELDDNKETRDNKEASDNKAAPSDGSELVKTGAIYIDDVDISSLGLHTLRSKISIIPQDPVLFIGSLRDNIDPFKEFDDVEIWRILEEVQLKCAIQKNPRGLEAAILESGNNFSVGEKQLICLARALLKRNKILVVDEATANVDHRTDDLIQKTIRDKFHDCTILTIAHRLNTIMDSDRVMVMDKGEIVEFDSAFNLLEKGKGHLYNLAASSKDFYELLELAKTKTRLTEKQIL